MDIDYYKEQLQAKEAMLASTSSFLSDMQKTLQLQNEQLVDKQREIFSSVNFAKLIQTSLLPDVNVLKVFFKDACYKILQQIGIGGDTIFIKNTNTGIVFGLLDATGHGIPASMLSISGSLILNEISLSMELESPKILLDLLNYRLHNTFNRNNNSIAHFEGAIFYYSYTSRKIIYSSANGKALFITKEGRVHPLQVSKASIGHNQNISLQNFDLEYQQGAKLVLFSDGLVDQFGGEFNRKYMTRRLKQLLETNYQLSAQDLAQLLMNDHYKWRGTNQQTDDISFIIIEFYYGNNEQQHRQFLF